MADIFAIAMANILSPMVLFFALGFGAALLRSDLVVPEAIAKGLALYLMLAIGFKGGAGIAEGGSHHHRIQKAFPEADLLPSFAHPNFTNFDRGR
jgi:hypothetical protein